MTAAAVPARRTRSARRALLRGTALIACALAGTPIGAQLPEVDDDGGATINDVGKIQTVNLGGQSRVITYNSYNVDATFQVKFIDGKATADPQITALNRVPAGKGASLINGTIESDANVSVFLINPDGITFGAAGSFSGGSLVLSTLPFGGDVADLDPGKAQRFAGASTNGIELKAGSALTAKAGSIVAVAQRIDADGAITADSGTVALIAASDVSFAAGAGSPLAFTVTAGTTLGTAQVDVKGAIQGGSIRIAGGVEKNVTAALLNVDTGATLKATKTGGSVVLATAGTTVGSDAIIITNTAPNAPDISFAGALTTAATGVENRQVSAGNLLVKNDNDLALTGKYLAAGKLDFVSVNGKITGDATVFAQSNTDGNGGGDLTLTAHAGNKDIGLDIAGQLSGGTADERTAVRAIGKNVALGNVAALLLGDADDVLTGGAITVGDVVVKQTLELKSTTGSITTGALAASDTGADVKVSSFDAALIQGNVTAAGVYSVSGKSVTLGTAGQTRTQTAAAAVAITATDTDIKGLGSLTLTSAAGGSGVGELTLSAGTGDVTFDALSKLNGGTTAARTKVNVIGQSVTLGGVTGLSLRDADDVLTGTSVTLGDVDVTSTLSIESTVGGVTTGGLKAIGTDADVLIDSAAAAAIAGDVTASRNYYVEGTSITLGVADATKVRTQTAGGEVKISATNGDIKGLGALTLASNSDGVSGGDLSIKAAATKNVEFSAASTVKGGDTAQRTKVLVLGDSVTLGTVFGLSLADAGDVTPPIQLTGKSVTLGNVDVAETLDAVATTGNLTTGNVVVADGAIVLTVANPGSSDAALLSTGSLTVNKTGGITLLGQNGADITTGALSAPGKVTATGDALDIGSAMSTGGNVELNASGVLRAGTLKAGSGAIEADVLVDGTKAVTLDGDVESTGVYYVEGASVTLGKSGETRNQNARSEVRIKADTDTVVGLGALTLASNTDGKNGGQLSLKAAAGQNVSFAPTTSVKGGTAAERTEVRVLGDSVALGNVFGLILADIGDASDPVQLTGKAVTLGDVNVTKTLDVRAGTGDMRTGNVIVEDGAIVLTAANLGASDTVLLKTGDLTVLATGGITLEAQNGADVSAKALSSPGKIFVSGNVVDVASAASLAGVELKATGTLRAGALSGVDVVVSGPDAVTVDGNVTASGKYLVTGKSVTLGLADTAVAQNAAGQVAITATAGAITGRGDADGATGGSSAGLTLQSNSDGTGGEALTLDATGAITFQAQTTVTGGAAAAKSNVLVSAPTLELDDVNAALLATIGNADGQLKIAGAVKLGDVKVDQALKVRTVDGSITTDTVTVSGATKELSLFAAGTDRDVTTGALRTAGGDVLLSAKRDVTTGSIRTILSETDAPTAGSVAVLAGRGVTLGALAVGEDLGVRAGTTTTLGALSAGDDVRVVIDGGLILASAEARGSGPDTRAITFDIAQAGTGGIAFGAETAPLAGIQLFAAGGASDLIVAGDLATNGGDVLASAGRLISLQGVRTKLTGAPAAGTVAMLAGAGVTAGAIQAGEDVAVRGGAATTLGALNAGDDIDVISEGALSIASASTTGTGLDERAVVFTPVQAGTPAGIALAAATKDRANIRLYAAGAASDLSVTGNLSAPATIALLAGNNVSVGGSATAGEDLAIQAGGAGVLADLTAGDDIDLVFGGALDFGTAETTTGADDRAVAFDPAASDRSLGIKLVGPVSDGSNIRIKAGQIGGPGASVDTGLVLAGGTSTGSATLSATKGDIRIGTLTSIGGNVLVTAGQGSASGLAANRDANSGGDVIIASGAVKLESTGTIRLASVSAQKIDGDAESIFIGSAITKGGDLTLTGETTVSLNFADAAGALVLGTTKGTAAPAGLDGAPLLPGFNTATLTTSKDQGTITVSAANGTAQLGDLTAGVKDGATIGDQITVTARALQVAKATAFDGGLALTATEGRLALGAGDVRSTADLRKRGEVSELLVGTLNAGADALAQSKTNARITTVAAGKTIAVLALGEISGQAGGATLTAGEDVALSAGGAVTLADVLAGDDISIETRTTAGGDVFLGTAQTFGVAAADVRMPVLLAAKIDDPAGAITLPAAAADGSNIAVAAFSLSGPSSVADAETGLVVGTLRGASQNLVAEAGDIRIRSLTADAGGLVLRADQGSVFGRDTAVDGGVAAATKIDAFDTVRLDITTGANVNAIGGRSSISIGTGAIGQSVRLGTVTGGSLDVTAVDTVQVDGGAVAGPVFLRTTGGSRVTPDLLATPLIGGAGEANLNASVSVRVTALSGVAQLDTVTAGTSIAVAARALDVATATAGTALDLTASHGRLGLGTGEAGELATLIKRDDDMNAPEEGPTDDGLQVRTAVTGGTGVRLLSLSDAVVLSPDASVTATATAATGDVWISAKRDAVVSKGVANAGAVALLAGRDLSAVTLTAEDVAARAGRDASFASLTAGDNAALRAEGDLFVTSAATTGTGLDDRSFVLTLADAGRDGGIELGGDALAGGLSDLSAGRNVRVGAASSAEGGMRLTASDGDLAAETLSASGLIAAQARGSARIGAATSAGGSVALLVRDGLTATTLAASEDIAIKAGGAVGLGTVAAGDDVEITTNGAVTLTKATAGPGAPDSRAIDFTLAPIGDPAAIGFKGQARTGNNIEITAASLSGPALTGDTDTGLVVRDLTGGSFVLSAAGDARIGQLTATQGGIDITAAQGSISGLRDGWTARGGGLELSARDDVILNVGGVEAGTIRGDDLAVTGTDVRLGTVTVATLTVTSTTNLQIDGGTVGGAVSLTAQGAPTGASTLEGARLVAGYGAANLLAQADGKNIVVTAANGVAQLGDVTAGGAVTATARALDAENVTARTGALALLATDGMLGLGAGSAATTVDLLKEDRDAVAPAGDVLQVRRSVTGGTGTAIRSLTDAVVAEATATRGDLTVNAKGDATVSKGSAGTGAIVLLAGGNAGGGALTAAGEDIAVSAGNAISFTGALTAGDNIELRAPGNVTLAATTTTGGGADDRSFALSTADAGQVAAIKEGTTKLANGGILLAGGGTVTLGGALTAAATDATVTIRNTGTGRTAIGGANDGGFALTETEMNRISADRVVIDSQTRDITFGNLATAGGLGDRSLQFLTTGAVTIGGRISGSSAGVLQIGGTDTVISGLISPAILASRIELNIGQSGAGPAIDFRNGVVDLRARKIVFGNSGLIQGVESQSNAAVALRIASADPVLYSADGTSRTFLSARQLRVSYSDYALFQNTAATLGGGVLLNDGSPNTNALALQLFSTGDNGTDSFALFGRINGFIGRSAGVLPNGNLEIAFGDGPARVVRITQANSRVNGCVIGSPDKGCLVTDPPRPNFSIYDQRQTQLFGATDDAALQFNPLVGRANEGLFVDIADAPVGIDTLQCAPGDINCAPTEERK